MDEIYTININNCFVQNSTDNVVSISAPNLSLHVSYSTFYYCTSSKAGAAVSFYSQSSKIEYVCGCYCFSETIKDIQGSFITTYLDLDPDYENSINMISTSYSPNNKNVFGSITLINGNISCIYCNSTRNLGAYNPSIYFLQYNRVDGYKTITKYVNINNCTATNSIFQFSFLIHEISFSNVIDNKQIRETSGICRLYLLTATFTNTTFLENVGNLFCLYKSDLFIISSNSESNDYNVVISESGAINNQFEINTFTQMNEKGTRCVYKVKLTVMKNNKSFKLRPYTMLFLINHSS